MARLGFGGFEGGSRLVDTAGMDGAGSNGTVSIESPGISGDYLLRAASGSAGRASIGIPNVVSDRWYFARVRFSFSAFPSSNDEILCWGNTTGVPTARMAIYLRPTGLTLFTLVPSPVVPLDPGEHVLELAVRRNTSTNRMDWMGRVDGELIPHWSEDSTSMFTPNALVIGSGSPSHDSNYDYDDWAVNDETGTDDNSWPGVEGRTAMLLPVADAARDAGWLNGGSGTADLFDAVNDRPPGGLAFASRTATSQITNALADDEEEYVAECAAWQDVIAPGAVLTHARGVAEIGAGAAAVVGGGLALSVDEGASYGTEAEAATGGSAAGDWSTNWARIGTPVMDLTAEAIDPAVGPRLKLRKDTISTTPLMCCQMGVMVEYLPPPPVLTHKTRAGGAFAQLPLRVKDGAVWRGAGDYGDLPVGG